MCFLSCLHFQRLNRHLFVGMLDILLSHVLNPGGVAGAPPGAAA